MLQEKVKEDFMVEKKGKKKCDRRTKERSETNCKEKTLHEKFPKSIVDFADSISWQCLSSRYVKKYRSNYCGCSRSSIENELDKSKDRWS